MKNIIRKITLTTLLSLMSTASVFAVCGADINMNGRKITELATPTVATDATNKEYVDQRTNDIVVTNFTKTFSNINLATNNLTTSFGLTLMDTTALGGDENIVYLCTANISPSTNPGWRGNLAFIFIPIGTNGSGTSLIPSTFITHTGGWTVDLQVVAKPASSGHNIIKIKSNVLKNSGVIEKIKCRTI